MEKDDVLKVVEEDKHMNPMLCNYCQQYSMTDWINLSDNKSANKAFVVICFAMNKKNSVLTSVSSIAAVSGMGLPSTSKALSWLESNGFITRIKHMNCYLITVNAKIAWKNTTGTRIKVLHEEANVLFAERIK